MEGSAEKLLKSIGKLEEQLATGGDALTQVKLGEMRKQFRRKTGKEAPSIQLGLPETKFGKIGSIHIGDINISGEGHAISPGGIAVLNQATSQMLSDSLARTGGNADLVMETNDLKDIFPNKAALLAAASAAPVDPATGKPSPSYPSHVCRVECHDANGNPISHGTGFLVASGLVLTCRHVLKNLNDLSSVTFRFSGPIGKGLLGKPDVLYSHTLHANATKVGGRPFLWLDSPPFETDGEFGSGNRDLALLEIDRDTERWGVFIEAGPTLGFVAVAEVLARVVDPTHPLNPSFAAANNPDDTQKCDLLRPAIPGGITKSSARTDSSSTIPTHDADDTERGDSGSPLVSTDGRGLVGMHTSKEKPKGGIDPRGRFVHVHDIRDKIDANSQLKNSNHRGALEGWIS